MADASVSSVIPDRDNHSGPRIVVALDYSTADSALAMAAQLDPARCRVKVGKELFTREGPGVIAALHQRGFEVFLDLKFHDIPNTVAGALRAAAELGVWMVNVHAMGGPEMLNRARAAIDAAQHRPLLMGVTVLTSMDAGQLHAIGIDCKPEEQVLRLARLCADCGLDGVVCSAREAELLKTTLGSNFQLITPGIRPPNSPPDDQRRTLSVAEAIQQGSDYLVIGRPITQAQDPRAALEGFAAAVEQASGH